jgi:hypothetical protein
MLAGGDSRRRSRLNIKGVSIMKNLIAAAVAAVFALPVAALAAGDKAPSSASTSGSSGAEAMFKSMDKNNDGFISKEEAKGTPHDKDFATLDKNNDGKLSRDEHAAAPEHAGDKRPAPAAGGTPSPSGGTSSPGSAPSKGY